MAENMDEIEEEMASLSLSYTVVAFFLLFLHSVICEWQFVESLQTQ